MRRRYATSLNRNHFIMKSLLDFPDFLKRMVTLCRGERRTNALLVHGLYVARARGFRIQPRIVCEVPVSC